MPPYTAYILYAATFAGAAGLFLLMPKASRPGRSLGWLLVAGGVGGLWLTLAKGLPESLGRFQNAFQFHYLFSGIAIFAAIKVITHTRPVYAALWFILVILSSAGLFLVLSAEFMAFAMVIIYGGAILVTYMFVLMLAAQSRSGDESAASPTYDRVAHDPLLAVTAGFVLLAVLLSVAVRHETIRPNAAAADAPSEQLAASYLGQRRTDELTRRLNAALPAETGANAGADETAEQGTGADAQLAATRTISNGEHVGLDLFRKHPLGLELAGLILLISLIGAIVIAKKRVYEEDDVMQAADTQESPT